MAERLPVVTGDIGTWGSILNAYLGVSLDSAGFLKDTISSGAIRNVKDARFGATGDGVTNDATAISSAHTDLPSTGGILYFPPGTYLCGTTRLNFSKPITLLGQGWASTLQWNVTGLSDPGGNDRGVLNIRHSTSGSALDWIKILGLAFDFGGTRVSTYAEGRRGLNIYRANNTEIRGCRFKGGVGEMVGISNFDTPGVDRLLIHGCVFTDWAQTALNANADFERIVNNHFYTGGGGAIEIGRPSQVVVHGNHAEDIDDGFLAIGAVAFSIVGNTLIDTLQDKAGTRASLTIQGGGSTSAALYGTIGENVIRISATGANEHGIIAQRGTATSDHRYITITGNTIQGARNGILLSSYQDGTISGNTLIGDAGGSGVGIALGTAVQVARNAIHGNNIRDYAARTGSITTNGPIQDSTTTADLNVVGWNTQAGTSVYGVSGRIDFTDLDTTPSVAKSAGIYFVANSVATTITQLDDGTFGQTVTLRFDDANTTIADGGNFLLNGAFTSTANDTLTLTTANGTTWSEVSRSVN